MNTKMAWFCITALCTLFLFVGAYMYLNIDTSGTKSAPVRGVVLPTSLDKFIEVPLLADTERKETNPKENYSVNIHYPKIALVNHDDLAKEANAVIFTFVDDTIRDFKKDTADMYSPLVPKEFTSDLTMRWRAELVSPTMISIRFDHSEYIAGAAHPNTENKVLNYDIERRGVQKTADLFASSTEALPFLSSYTRDALQRSSPDISKEELRDMLIPGTEPTIENFANVAIGPDGLVVIFNPYQVAPYARGSQEVRIPLSAMEGLLAPRVLDAMRMGKTNIREATPEGGEQ